MLAELWSRYGDLFHIWFDGGALPPEKGGPDMLPLLAKYQPKANVFQGPAATVRWIGNEAGVSPYPCWHTVVRRRRRQPGRSRRQTMAARRVRRAHAGAWMGLGSE